MAPVVHALEARRDVRSSICITGQHRQMLDPMLELFELRADHDLAVMRPDQSLSELTAAILTGMGPVLEKLRPDWVLVHGDTTTAMAASLAAFYARCRVAHVEAGLRTGDRSLPWPEEMNRRLVAPLAALHFAPTESARENLLAEGIPEERILVTGNTVIDALLHTVARNRADTDWRESMHARWPVLNEARRMILVTGHRRENHGAGLEELCQALARLADRGDVVVVFPVHLNPRVRDTVYRLLGEVSGVELMDPLDYRDFLLFLEACEFIITDSGGIQEEAPSLGKPVLVTRTTTERPEAVRAGLARLVGSDGEAIYQAATTLLDDPDALGSHQAPANPYGDGCAGERIVERLLMERLER